MADQPLHRTFCISVSKNKKIGSIFDILFYIFGLVQYTLCNIFYFLFLFLLKDMVFHAANMDNFSPKREKKKKKNVVLINLFYMCVFFFVSRYF